MEQHVFALVLLDLHLPDADGLVLLSEMKTRQPSTPVVVFTGYGSLDKAVDAIRRGASDYMPKPFTPRELSAVTNRFLENDG
jgi:two-component system response regulator HydG